MEKLAMILALAALGVGGYALLDGSDKAAQIETLGRANVQQHEEILDLQARLENALGSPQAQAHLLAASDGTAGAPAASDPPAGTATLATRKAATPVERLAELEKRVARQDEHLARLDEREAKLSKQGAPVRRFSARNWYGNLDQAAKALKLDDRQKEDVKDILDRAQRDLGDLYKTPNDDGVTWNQVRKPKMVEGGGISLMLPDMKKLAAFRKSRIPGSNETFGHAQERIRNDAFARVRNTLTPAQAKQWDQAHKEPLLRGGPGAFSVAIASFGSDSGK
jgi:hypothetical protein